MNGTIVLRLTRSPSGARSDRSKSKSRSASPQRATSKSPSRSPRAKSQHSRSRSRTPSPSVTRRADSPQKCHSRSPPTGSRRRSHSQSNTSKPAHTHRSPSPPQFPYSSSPIPVFFLPNSRILLCPYLPSWADFLPDYSLLDKSSTWKDHTKPIFFRISVVHES